MTAAPDDRPLDEAEPEVRLAGADSSRFERLPDRIAPEDYVEVMSVPPTPDPTAGRNTDQDAALRAGG